MNKNHKINIISVLASYGIAPENIHNNSAWFKSPFRNEVNASFKVDINKDIWYDFGLGEGGNATKLVSKLNNVSPKEAYQTLSRSDYPKVDLGIRQNEDATVKILSVKRPIKHLALINYLLSRRIDLKKAHSCNVLKEIEYQIRERKYYALGFENDKSGFEIRNPYWKGASSPKSITTIRGFTKSLNVFEGFMDYLSALTYYGKVSSGHTSIVLNSTSLIQQLITQLPLYEKVYMYVDNDDAGRKVVEQVMQIHSNVVNESMRLYPAYKDFNDFLCKKR